MGFEEKITEALNSLTNKTGDLGIKDWHFSLAQSRNVKIGIKDEQFGSPYNPPTSGESVSGGVYIIWKDNNVSKGTINVKALENIEGAIEEWRNTSFSDEFSPEIIEPVPVPLDLKTYDPRVAKIANGEIKPLFEKMFYVFEGLKKRDDTESISTSASASIAHISIINSKGLDVRYDKTGIGVNASCNKRTFSEGAGNCRMLTKGELNHIFREAEKIIPFTNKKARVPNGEMKIVVMPDTVSSLIGAYISPLLSGDSIAKDTALYGKNDFLKNRKVFDKRINVIVDGFEEYGAGTQPCNVEGVPAGIEHLIANGRLIAPITSLRDAKRLRCKPTCAGQTFFKPSEYSRHGALIKNMERGMIVYSILGMHTQDTSQGNFNLPIDMAFYVENGQVMGLVENKPVMNGNLFDALNSKKTKFATYNKETSMMFRANVRGL